MHHLSHFLCSFLLQWCFTYLGSHLLPRTTYFHVAFINCFSFTFLYMNPLRIYLLEFVQPFSSLSTYISLVFDASFPLETSPKLFFKSSPSVSTSLIHVLPCLILPSYNWPFSPSRTINFTHIHFLRKLHFFFQDNPNYLSIYCF